MFPLLDGQKMLHVRLLLAHATAVQCNIRTSFILAFYLINRCSSLVLLRTTGQILIEMSKIEK